MLAELSLQFGMHTEVLQAVILTKFGCLSMLKGILRRKSNFEERIGAEIVLSIVEQKSFILVHRDRCSTGACLSFPNRGVSRVLTPQPVFSKFSVYMKAK